MLMDNLRRNNVRYLIVANLRANPEENNGIILKSVNLYIYFLRLRYKHIFRNIHTIGDEEPAYLIEVNLSK
jgi:hypothetical protein